MKKLSIAVIIALTLMIGLSSNDTLATGNGYQQQHNQQQHKQHKSNVNKHYKKNNKKWRKWRKWKRRHGSPCGAQQG